MVEAQVYPFKLFALLTDGTIHTNAVYPVHKVITASSGTLSIDLGANRTIGTDDKVFAYPKGHFGDEDYLITGTFSNGVFTPSTTITDGDDYEVGYIVTVSSDVQRITFGNEKVPQDYFITMSTLDKDEEGTLTPFLIKAYKATVQRTWELSFSSEGDPATVTVTFDLLEDKEGNILDMIELNDEVGEAAGLWTSLNKITVKIGAQSQNIRISNAQGTVTASFKDASGATATSKFNYVISGDNDSIIVSPKSSGGPDANADYTLTLTDTDNGNKAEVIISVKPAS